MITQIITIGLIGACISSAIALAYYHGRREGEGEGRTKQWCDDYFRHQQTLREMRDKDGKFKSKKYDDTKKQAR